MPGKALLGGGGMRKFFQDAVPELGGRAKRGREGGRDKFFKIICKQKRDLRNFFSECPERLFWVGEECGNFFGGN